MKKTLFIVVLSMCVLINCYAGSNDAVNEFDRKMELFKDLTNKDCFLQQAIHGRIAFESREKVLPCMDQFYENRKEMNKILNEILAAIIKDPTVIAKSKVFPKNKKTENFAKHFRESLQKCMINNNKEECEKALIPFYMMFMPQVLSFQQEVK